MALLVAAAVCAAGGPASAQVRPVLTDQAALSLGLPSTYDFGDGGGLGARSVNGDVVFTDDSRVAIFLKRSGSSIVRLLQVGDAVPGIANTYIDYLYPPMINATGVVCLQIGYSTGVVGSTAIVTYSGSTYTTVVQGSDAVAGVPGAVFGRGISLRSFNNAGDVAFTSTLLPLGVLSGTPVTTLFISLAGSTPVRVIGAGDVATGTGGLTVVSFTPSTINTAGEVLFTASLTNGSATTYGVFVGSTSGVRKIVANGDAKPGGGTFSLTSSAGTAFINNLGTVAYTDAVKDVIYVHTVASGMTPTVTLATAVPSPLDSRTLTALTLGGINDSGVMAFSGTLTGTSTNNNALFRYTPSEALFLVAYKGQTAPVSGGAVYYNFQRMQLNSLGDIAFYSSSSTSTASIGIFKSPVGDYVSAVATVGMSTGLSGGGTFKSPNYLALGEDGVVYVESLVEGGAARSLLFSTAPSTYGPIVSTADALPSGARVTSRTSTVSGAGEYALFGAQYAGGPASFVLHHTASATTTRVAGIGDAAPGGGVITAFADFHEASLNAGGTVVFGAWVDGTSGYLLAWSQATGLIQVAGPGDTEPTSGNTFTGAYPPISPSRTGKSTVNVNGQVAFRGTFSTTDAGLYVATPSEAIGKIVRANSSSPYGDAAPSGGQFYSIARFLINAQGQVAFQAQTRTTDGNRYDGIFIATTTPGSLQTVWISSAPTTTAISTLAALDDDGRVVFFAPGAGGLTNLYVGTGGGTPVAVATNGAAAPAGGNYAFTATSMDADVNVLGDIVFQAPMSGGTATTGLFLYRRSSGLIESIAVSGQSAPDTGLLFSSLPATINAIPGETFAIGPTGEVMFWSYIEQSGVHFVALYRYGVDTVLEKLAHRGDAAVDSGDGTYANFSQAPGAGRAGLFFFRAYVVGGSFTTAIYTSQLETLSVSSLTANRTSPSTIGTAITWTATAVGGRWPLQYKFYRYKNGVGWAMVQDYSTSRTYTWTPTEDDSGTYTVQVWVKSRGSANPQDAWRNSTAMTIPNPIVFQSITTNRTSPMPCGGDVIWTANVTGGQAPLQYQFWRYKNGVGWTMAQAYSTTKTYTWSTTCADAGTYTVQVWVRNAGSTATYDAWQNSAAMTVAGALSLTSVTANRTSPYGCGTVPITWTATSTGGLPPVQYQFSRYKNGVGWSTVQTYSTSNTYTWTPSCAEAGTYTIQAWARAAGSTASYDAWVNSTPMIVSNPITISGVTPSPGSPAAAGTPITWTASVSGGAAPLSYQFWLYSPGTGWSVLRSYSTTNTASWTPSTPGTYTVQVWIRNAGSGASYDAWQNSAAFIVQ